MKLFSEIRCSDEMTLKGKGKYESYNKKKHIQIEAIDREILTGFIDAIQNKKKLPYLEITGEESDATFSGPFIVLSVKGNDITLIKA